MPSTPQHKPALPNTPHRQKAMEKRSIRQKSMLHAKKQKKAERFLKRAAPHRHHCTGDSSQRQGRPAPPQKRAWDVAHDTTQAFAAHFDATAPGGLFALA